MKIDNIKFNDSTVDSLSFNGQEVTKLVMPNGDYWENGSSSEPVLKLAFIGASVVARGGDALYTLNNFTTTSINGEACFTIALPILENKNTGGIIANKVYSNNSVIWTSFIDEYALLMIDSSNFGTWKGDQYTQIDVVDNWTFKAANNSSIGSKVTVTKRLNETPRVLIEGMTRSRALRVAHIARTGNYAINRYPYYYYAAEYLTPMTLLPIEKNNNGLWEEGDEHTDFTNHYQIQDANNAVVFDATIQKDTLNNVFDTSDTSESPIDFRVNYSISQNNTSDYRDFVFAIGDVVEDSRVLYSGMPVFYGECIIHFIQEPYAKNRIYYGRSISSDFSDQYSFRTNTYHSFFETCSSKVLADDFVLATVASSLYAGSYYIAYPNDLEYDVLQTSGRYTVQSSQYMWGDRAYTILKCTQAGKVTFNKK